jgi:hypothetical protein
MFLPLMIDDAESKTSRYHIKLAIHVSYPNENINTHQIPLGARVTKEFLVAVRKETCPPGAASPQSSHIPDTRPQYSTPEPTPLATPLLAAHKRLLTRAKVAYLYRQKPYEAHNGDRLVLVLEMQSAEPGRRARYCSEEGATRRLFR